MTLKPLSSRAKRLLKYIAIASLPLLVLLYQPFANFAVLHMGEEILLETVPVDPRDILRGDYVALSYRISTVPKAPKASFSELQKGGALYVALERNPSGVAKISGASTDRPKSGLYLKGRVTYFSSNTIHCDYGLGAYYVPEGTGRELEEAVRHGQALAKIRVFKGRGVIEEIVIKRDKDRDKGKEADD